MAIEEVRAIELATKAAESRGFSVEDYAVDARLTGEYWEVSYSTAPIPGRFGGDGFMVRLKYPTLEFIDLQEYQ